MRDIQRYYDLGVLHFHIEWEEIRKESRDELIKLRNKLAAMMEIKEIMEKHNLYEAIRYIEVRKDIQPLWFNVAYLKKFIEALSEVIMEKAQFEIKGRKETRPKAKDDRSLEGWSNIILKRR